MKHKLKYIELFENYTNDGVKIPYSKIDNYGKLNIKFRKSAKSIPLDLNKLTTEVTGDIEIEYNPHLHTVTEFESLQLVGGSLRIRSNTVLETVKGFNQLQKVRNYLSINFNPVLKTVTGFNQLQEIWDNLCIIGNISLHTVTGFNQLQKIWRGLWIKGNSNLVTLSIPSIIIRSVNYKDYCIMFEMSCRFYSPEEFINSDDVIKDCIEKFNPVLHSDVVVSQIIENIETWGTSATQGVIINHLLSKGNYWSLIPTSIQHLAEEHYKHLYHSDFKNTGAKSVAKVATGVTYGLF